MKSKTPSPCVGVCVLDPTWSKFCVGCYRFLDEIVDWDDFSEKKKQDIVQRITDLREEDTGDYPRY
jgi:predicted Fe-S protein YdhL (DUF1289 family)